MDQLGILILSCFIVLIASQKLDPDTKACIRPDDARGQTCSGHGDCVSGRCQCSRRRIGSAERFTGKYCECDDYSCPYDNLHICGGNGRCKCGECDCYDGVQGSACEISIAETCIASNGKVCNGTGECQADGTCICHLTTTIVGPTCEEICLECGGQCWDARDCAECTAFKTGPYDEDTCEKNCTNVEVVDTLPGIQSVRTPQIEHPDHTTPTSVASYQCMSVMLGVCVALLCLYTCIPS